jgi:SAM-dependent methyltransferase
VSGYAEDLAAIHAAGFTDLARDAARELLGRLPPGARIVELGCGDGTTARALSDAGHEVHGIDQSPALVALARRRAPRASFEVGSFVDAELPGERDAIIAVGEVLGYALDARVDAVTLDRVFARCARALRAGGLLVFDLAGPGRGAPSARRGWSEGDGWAVLVETDAGAGERRLTRRIVTFRDVGGGRFRRSAEVHRLVLHRPSDVLARLRRAGFTARTLKRGYGGGALPPGLTAYVARKARGGASRPS